jgi:hypothetical protein
MYRYNQIAVFDVYTNEVNPTSRVSSPYTSSKGEGERVMYQKQAQISRSSGAKAIAVDQRAIQARYRLLQLIALLLSAGFAVSLQLIFGR